MKATELRGKSVDDLLKELKTASETLFSRRFQTEVEQMNNPSEIRSIRRDIARLKTVLREKGVKT